jgi:phosphoglycerol transferase MdoB-like AlkP superfamily enzyme
MPPLSRLVPSPSRFFPLHALLGIMLLLSFGTRLALLLRADAALGSLPGALLHVFGIGLLFDLAAASYCLAPLALYLLLLPNRVAAWRPHRWLFSVGVLVAIYGLCLLAISEWLFWDEFAARFNFIAVDYLIYTHEVLGNIWESYPVGTYLLLLLVPSLLLWLPLLSIVSRGLQQPSHLAHRLRHASPWLVAPVLVFFFVSNDMKAWSVPDTENELAGNGIFEFFAANYNNELDYEKFYPTLPHAEAMAVAREPISAGTGRWMNDQTDSVQHTVLNPGVERHMNIVLISVESLGAEFLGSFGNPAGLTPNLDRLAGESLFFSNVYATGNRTVRGLEALSLSIPPTPGQSIVRRPHNNHLLTIGGVLEDKGYQVDFIYGGYGYFDNMNAYFSANDYRVVDRTALSKQDIHYENIWGVADEDLFTLALREFDAAYQGQGGRRPFFGHIMTTSNHRPYTYPAGRIDIPSGTGRDGAVKYTDWAIGEFLRQAAMRPWFGNTLFVITADHGASARGSSKIPLEKYRIPLFVYAPGQVKPQRIDRLMSQIDIVPTVLGLLNMRYVSKFYGHDIFRTPMERDRAFVANYQTLGYMKAGRLVTLQVRRKSSVESLPVELGLPVSSEQIRDEQLLHEAISFYESASYAFRHGLYKDEERNTGVIR